MKRLIVIVAAIALVGGGCMPKSGEERYFNCMKTVKEKEFCKCHFVLNYSRRSDCFLGEIDRE